MKVPLSWLKEYVDISVPVDELARLLTNAGFEVEEVTLIGADWDADKIMVGEILEVQPHPNADRLTVPQISYGAGRSVQVVTGAPNIKVGMRGVKVALALEGARYIDGHSEERKVRTLKPGKLRGVESQGMVMSELELGLSEEHEGVILLDDDAPVGLPLRDYLGDAVLTIAILPNIARALSILGVAREVAALTGARLHLPEIQVEMAGPPLEGRAQIEIRVPELCPRFALGLIEGITVGPSPKWMQRRLSLAGMRPISNVVDISNYVMLELGEPNHMFDADQVQQGHVIIRSAEPGERLTTLDGKTHTLSAERVLVCDPRGPLSLAGVMGGAESEVSERTTRVLVEAAIWQPVSIRRTVQELKLPSEASRRFERGVDPELPPVTIVRCLQLLRQYAGGTVAQGLLDQYPGRQEPRVIDLPPAELRRLLGISLPAQQIAELLRQLGFGTQMLGEEAQAIVRVSVPSYRLDVQHIADLCEEVARLYGYDRIPTEPLADQLPEQQQNRAFELEQYVRDVLVGCGLNEISTYSLTNMASVASIQPEAAQPEQYVRLLNPPGPEREYMRRSLLPSLAEVLGPNLRESGRVAVFEVARVYLPQPGAVLPAEPRRVAIGLAGPRQGLSWHTPQSEAYDYYDLKGIVEELLERLNLQGRASYQAISTDPRLHPGRAARLLLQSAEGSLLDAGVLGELHPRLRSQFDLPVARVALAELDLELLISQAAPRQYQVISRYPAILQDLAVLADAELPAEQIGACIRKAGGELLESLTLWDIYTGPQVGEGKRSLTYRLSFRATDRTLSEEQIARQRQRIIRSLEQELSASIRA